MPGPTKAADKVFNSADFCNSQYPVSQDGFKNGAKLHECGRRVSFFFLPSPLGLGWASFSRRQRIAPVEATQNNSGNINDAGRWGSPLRARCATERTRDARDSRGTPAQAQL